MYMVAVFSVANKSYERTDNNWDIKYRYLHWKNIYI